MKVCILIDYDNLLASHRVAGVLSIVTRALMLSPLPTGDPRGSCIIRIYGGWYEAANMTIRAQDVTAAVQNEFPTMIRVASGQGLVQLTAVAELAVSLLEEPAHSLFDTYRRKAIPGNIRVQTPADVGCADQQCPLPATRRLLKSGRCPIPHCAIAAEDLIYRHEQKLVDTMLSCDLLYASSQNYDKLLLISGDDDFIPPIRTALLRGTSIVRLHPKPTSKRAASPNRGASLIELDL